MKPEKPTLSLIVPTLGREKDLHRLLDSLRLQTNRDFEIILVDQSEHPNLVKSIVKKYSPFLSIRHLEQKERGAARARHAGVRLAQGEILGWPDDDCWYEPQTVERVIAGFSQEDRTSVLFGIPLNEDGSPYNRWLPKEGRSFSNVDILNFGIEWTLFMKADCYRRSAGFDPRIGAGAGTPWAAGESSDLCLRIAAAKEKICYSPSIRIHHPQARSQTDDSAIKAKKYAYGMGAVCRKNGLSFFEILVYFWGYFRAFIWALLKLRIRDMSFHWSRICGFLLGYYKYPSDLYPITMHIIE